MCKGIHARFRLLGEITEWEFSTMCIKSNKIFNTHNSVIKVKFSNKTKDFYNLVN